MCELSVQGFRQSDIPWRCHSPFEVVTAPFETESAILRSVSDTVFDTSTDLNVHAPHTSSRKTVTLVVVGTWHVFICG